MDSFTAALGRLDPASRALLDLSLRRGMTPQAIGDLLGTNPDSVVAAREAALEQVARELDMDDRSQLDEVRARLAELPADAWTGGDRPRLKVVKEDEKPARMPPPERRRSRLPLLLALLAVAAVALVIILASSGSSSKNNSPAPKPQASAPQPAPQKPRPAKQHKARAAKPKPAVPKPSAPQAKLAALGSAGATGTASLTSGGQRLVLKASGLPNATYQVWLYNSVIDATSLTKVSGTALSLDLKLPGNTSHYRYVDVSREPNDGNPNHSGESVLRVPLSKLSR
jgi:Anti-sigma-K factor rskA